jgi:poly-gamma-glutamate capsule biosynthesis protein CapA/YwtB (metallophosphatase superfamily)
MAAIDFLFTGDLVLDEPRPDYWLEGIAPAIRSADVAIGHLEVPHTDRGTELKGDVPAPGADPAHLAALERAGFDAVTLAGNHIADCGAEGIADTRAELVRLGIGCCGADENLERARQPAILRIADRRIAILSYNCVGPESSWATEHRAGCAYVRIDTADGTPITPTAALQAADSESLASMRSDISTAAGRNDFVIVALHKGLVHTPALLAPYERPVARAAIEAGAHVVVSHHAHMVRGIEFHLGRPVFHGLGNGCVVTRALSPTQGHPARSAWAQRRRQLFGFEPDPAYFLAPFHPEAIHAMLGRVRWYDEGRIETGFVPVHVEAPGRPVIAAAAEASQVTNYIARITTAAGLPALSFKRREDMVVAA